VPNPKPHPSRRHSARGRGQALVEFALVFPLFILLLAGMIDFGMGLSQYMTIINAARESARLGVTACTNPTGCKAAVEAKAIAVAGGIAPTVDVTCAKPEPDLTPIDCAAAGASSGDSVTVKVSYTYHMIWPLAFGTTIQLDSSVKMMIE
jgi:Flp pilus assembly protein TadG